MTEPDDDDLHDLDLHAWQAPAPPKGLADAVIARATATGEAIAVAKRGQRRRTLATAAFACGGSVAAALAVWLAMRPAPVHEVDMTVIAAAPQHVALGDTTVDLAPGAAIQTERRGDELHVVQSGTATWHVGAKDNVEIDAGKAGSIKATGASLRVESKMNTQNALLVGGGLLSAGAIALVTATVYEGHVEKVTDDKVEMVSRGDVVLVADKLDKAIGDVRRGKIEFELALKALEPLAVKGRADIAFEPGVSPTIWVAEAELVPVRVNIELQGACDLRVEIDDMRGLAVVVGTTPPDGVFDTAIGVGKYTYDASCAGKPSIHGAIEVRGETCRRAACGADPERMLNITAPDLGAEFTPPSVHVVGTTIDPEATTLSVGADVIKVAPSGDFAVDFDYGPSQSIALRIDHPRLGTQFFVQHTIAGSAATVKKAPPPPPACSEMSCKADGYAGACCSKFTKPDPKTCNANELLNAGTTASAQSKYDEALKDYSSAYACKPEPHTLSLTFMSACNASDLKAARIWWRKLSADERLHDVVICIRANITSEQLNAP